MDGSEYDPHTLRSTLWQELPFELLVKVITKLPISALMRFCQVSKRWKNLIQSVGFALDCHSVEPVLFYHHRGGYVSATEGMQDAYLALPNLKADSWEKHFLNFVSEDVDLVAADQGLLCFNTRYTDTLFVHNPLTRKWRRLRIPYELKAKVEFEYIEYKMLVGLVVDEKTGSYKLVVAFTDEDEPRETLLYDSQSDSWAVSAAVFPNLDINIEDGGEWEIGRSFCVGGELFWLVEEIEMDNDYHFKTLIKYSVKFATWTITTQKFPCYLQCNFHLTATQKELFMVNFDDPFNRDLFPPEFSDLVPVIRQLDAAKLEFLLPKAVENAPCKYIPIRAVAEGGFWYIAYEYDSISNLERLKMPVYVLAFSQDPQTSGIWLPGLHPNCTERLGTFTATFRAFV